MGEEQKPNPRGIYVGHSCEINLQGVPLFLNLVPQHLLNMLRVRHIDVTGKPDARHAVGFDYDKSLGVTCAFVGCHPQRSPLAQSCLGVTWLSSYYTHQT